VEPTTSVPAAGPDFFEELGLSGISLEEKIQLLEKVELSAREQVIALILDQLGEKDCRDLGDLIKNGALEPEILLFLKDRITDLDGLVAARIQRFKDELIEQVQSIQTDIGQLNTDKMPTVQPVDRNKAREELQRLEKKSSQALVQGKFDSLHAIHERIRELKKSLVQ